MSIREKNKNNGFSLIELMVTISIFLLITTVTMVNYPRFSNKLSLDLLAQDVALSFRQAQIFGSSVFGAKGISGQATTFGAYGVHFDAPIPNQPVYTYLLFADIGNSSHSTYREYDGPPADANVLCGSPVSGAECLEKFLVTGRNKVVALCANFIDSETLPAARVARCKANPLSSIDVVFVRPNLDAKIAAATVGGQVTSAISNIGIVMESPGGDYDKTVVVWKTGQISVE